MESFLAYLDEVWLFFGVLFGTFSVFFLFVFLIISPEFKGDVFTRVMKSILCSALATTLITLVVFILPTENQPEYKEYSLENFQGTSRSMVLSPFKEALNWDYKAKLFYNDRYVIICRQAKNDFKLAIKKIPEGFKTSKLGQALIVMKKDDF